jgi:hypothetical protein
MHLKIYVDVNARMIPKRLFQTHEYGIPPQVEAAVRDRAPDWDYQFYTHEDIVSYFAALREDDPDCKPLHNAICEAHDITRVKSDTACTNGTIKLADLLPLHEVFVYYYLYKTGGAYMDTGVIVHENQSLSAIVDPESALVAIESCLTPVLFTGFMACTPGHPVLQKAIQHINGYIADFRQCCRDGTKFDVAQMKVGSVMHAACKEALENATATVRLLGETIAPNESWAAIYDSNHKDTVLLQHFFIDKIVPVPVPVPVPGPVPGPVPKKDMRIGISAAVPSHMFNNGIHQNTLYFYDVLKNIGYTPYLVVTNPDYAKFKKSPPDGWNSARYENVVSFSQLHRTGFHAVVTFGVQISHIALQQLRHAGVKLVSYVCGNEYLINSEAILYNHGESGSFEQDKTNPRTSLFDEVWLIPQMMELNATYKRTLSRCAKVIEAPFIWSPDGMETIAKKDGFTLNDFLYINTKIAKEKNKPIKSVAKSVAKSMAIFDPNISIMKWFLPSFVLCERAYQLAPHLMDRVYITNAFREKIGDTMNAKKIENTVRYTDLFLDKRVFFEKRFITFEFMKTHADVAVFHQWGNPLNYIYLEMAWLGYPFVHNAHLCADLGYYYEGYNLEQGAEVLLGAMMKHDADAREYLRVNRERVDRYLPTNAVLQQKYEKMFDDLFFAP